MTSRTLFAAAAAVLTFVAAQPATTQDKQARPEDQVDRSVKPLEEFHTVIYKIWHTAWPDKDVRMLAGLLPEVQQLGDSLVNAKLPGIYREKQKAWTEQMTLFQTTLKEYAAATSPLDSVKLLDAAERLHSQYEKLVRTLRPAVKELDEFHVSLYMLYHYYLPEDKVDKIRMSASELKEKMKPLNAATLPARLKAKEEAFQKARAALSVSVDELAQTVNSDDLKVIKEKVEVVHSRYQELEKVFD